MAKSPFDRRVFVQLTGLLVCFRPTPLWARTEGEPLCVVVGTSSKLEALSLEELRGIFTLRLRSDRQGRHVVPLNHPARSTFRVGFDRAVLGMEPEQVADYWIERKRRRAPGPPRSVPSLSTLRRVLARLPETVGYLPPRQMTNQVRVLRIDGKYPEDQGYPVLIPG